MKRLTFLSIIFLILIFPDLSICDIYNDQLDKGIINSEYYVYSVLEKSKQSSNRYNLLRDLQRYSPDLPALYFELSRERFNFTFIGLLESFDYLIKGISKYKYNFWWSFSLNSTLILSILVSFIFSITIIAIIKFLKSIPLISHDINEDRKRLFIFLILILSILGPLYFLGLSLLISSLYFRKRESFILYIYIIFLLILPLIIRFTSFTINAPLSSKLRAIVEVNELKGNKYAISTLKDGRDYVEKFSYALALKREGKYNEAIDMYKNLLKERKDPIVLNNLANCYVGIKDLQKALELYQEAVDIQPNVTSFYNMSQVFRELLDFEKADKYFTLAYKENFSEVIRFRSMSSNNPNRFVMDINLPLRIIFKYAMDRTSYRDLDISLLPSYYYPISAIIILTIYLALKQRLKSFAYTCKRCGSVFCSKCEKRLLWGDMCLQCYRSLIKLDELDPKYRISRILKIYEYRSKKRNLIKFLNFLLPGTGHIYAGSTLQGFIFLWLFLFFITLIFINNLFSFGIGNYSHFWLNILSILFALIIYVVINLTTKRRLIRGWV